MKSFAVWFDFHSEKLVDPLCLKFECAVIYYLRDMTSHKSVTKNATANIIIDQIEV